MLDIYVDADGCPVKDEVYRVAVRCGLRVVAVANRRINMPGLSSIQLVVVGDAFDAADDWIASHADREDIVITSDIPLAARCLARGARVLGHRGGAFTEASIGDSVANRDLHAELRASGIATPRAAAFTARDRSSFLRTLDEMVQAVRHGRGVRRSDD
jgi:uncharacterized protein YaiI (UPF0178 family)